MALIENIQREDLNPIEEAAGIQRLIDEFGMTHEAAAEAVGRSRSGVTNLLRLLSLAKPVQDLVPWADVYFPYDPALADRRDLASVRNERRADLLANEIAELRCAGFSVRKGNNEVGIVIVRVQLMGPEVGHLMTRRSEMSN